MEREKMVPGKSFKVKYRRYIDKQMFRVVERVNIVSGNPLKSGNSGKRTGCGHHLSRKMIALSLTFMRTMVLGQKLEIHDLQINQRFLPLQLGTAKLTIHINRHKTILHTDCGLNTTFT